MKEKQIDKQAVEEMAEIMCDDCLSHFPKCARRVCDAVLQQAEVIYKAGYRKQSEGEWIICSDGYYPYCSNCKHEPKNGVMTDYCPNCGAKMKGGAEG